MESFAPTTPISLANYRVRRLSLDWPAARIDILLDEVETGAIRDFSYTGSTATTLMASLNKLDLSAQSLHARILNRLAADGKIPAGSVTGTPD